MADFISLLIVYAATKLDAPPQYHSLNVVRCRGERLSRILWQGRQWAVTAFGIECRDGTYAIRKDRLSENWIVHMAEKDWVDLDDFAEALRICRHLHAKHDRSRRLAVNDRRSHVSLKQDAKQKERLRL